MCSSGGQVAKDDQALQDANLAANTNFLNDAKTSFAEQQQVQAKQTALANNLISNPMGYTPKQLAIASTSINENFSRAAKNALGSAAAFAAAHGSSDIGGGGTGQIAGQIGEQVASGAASARADLANQNEAMKYQSMLTGLNELNTAGGAAQGAVSGSVSGAGTSGETTTGAGSGVLAAKEAGWQELGGVLGGLGGLVSAGASIPGVHV